MTTPEMPDNLPEVRMGQLRFGPDMRATKRSEAALGRVSWSPYSVPAVNPFSSHPSGITTGQATGFKKLSITDSPPFSADDQDIEFPEGTLWAVAWEQDEPTAWVWPHLVSPETINAGICANPKRKQWMMWRGTGIKAGHSSTITLQKEDLTELSSITVDGDNGPSQTIMFPEFDGFPESDGVLQAVSDWSTHAPDFEMVISHPMRDASYVAIPKDLPDGYTERIPGNLHYQDHGNRDTLGPGVPRPGPYISHEITSILIPDFGCGSFGFLWIDGEPWDYSTWLPEAIDQASFLLHATAAPDIVIPPPISITIPGAISNASGACHGLRSWSCFIQNQEGEFAVSTGGAGYLVVVKRTDTGATLLNATYTDAELVTGQTTTGGVVEHDDLGTDVGFTVELTRSGTPHTRGTVQVYFRGAYRCNIPLPYSITGRANAVRGGYLDTIAGTGGTGTPQFYPETNWITRLGASIDTYTPTDVDEPVAFLPDTDGWYQVLQENSVGEDVPHAGIGEYEFGQNDQWTAERGHAGRSFYVESADDEHDLVLTAYEPDFDPVDGAGAAMDFSDVGWVFGTFHLPSAATYAVKVLANTLEMLESGMVLEWSTTDELCIDTDGVSYFCPIDILAGSIASGWAGSDTDPRDEEDPSSAWLILPGATGKWEGHDNEVAVWDDVADGWHFLVPQAGSYMHTAIGDDWIVFDGAAWQDSGTEQITVRVRVDEPTDVYFTIRCFGGGAGSAAAHPWVEWAEA